VEEPIEVNARTGSRKTRRGLRLLPLAVALLIVGCRGRSGPPPSTVKLPASGGVLHILSEPARTLDPRAIDEVYESVVLRQIYQGLLSLDPSLRLEPCLAESWSISPDGLRYVFHIRRGILFHDGSPLTADDAAFSIQRCLDPGMQGACLAGYYLLQIVGAQDYMERRAATVRGLKVVDDHTLEIELAHPLQIFLKVLAMDQTVVVSRHTFEKLGARRAECEPNGTGPFRFVLRGVRGDAHLARNDAYWGTPALLDSLVFAAIPESRPMTEPRAIAAGIIDFATLGAGTAPEALSLGLSVYRSPELSVSFLALRTDLPPFNIPEIRRAVLLAIHRDAIVAKDPEGKIPVYGLLPPGLPGRDPIDRMPPTDPDAARRLLARAGHPDGKGLPKVTIAFSRGGEVSRQIAAQILADLEAIGLRVEVKTYPWAQLDSLAMEGELQAFVMSWVADLPDPESFLSPLFHSKGESNLFGYQSARVDSLLEIAHMLQLGPERSQIYLRLQETVLRDVPMVPLYHPSIAYAWRPELRGVEIGPTGLALVPFESVHFDAPSDLAQEGTVR
jgi:peptide/nickel transport system substrate-binding protein